MGLLMPPPAARTTACRRSLNPSARTRRMRESTRPRRSPAAVP